MFSKFLLEKVVNSLHAQILVDYLMVNKGKEMYSIPIDTRPSKGSFPNPFFL